MAIDGKKQIKINSIDRARLEQDLLAGSDLDLSNGSRNATLKGLKNAVLPDSPATLEQLQIVEAKFSGLLKYQGIISAAAFVGNELNDAKKGDFYMVSTSGTILASVDVNTGDMVIVNKDVTGTPVAADLDVIDNTESADIIRQISVLANLNSTDDTKVLAASQGKILKDMIVALQDQLSIKEKPITVAFVAGGKVLNALPHEPKAGTETLTINGIAYYEGDDWNINYVTHVITMISYVLEIGDTVKVGYER